MSLPSFPSKETGSQNLIQLRISVSLAFHKFTDFVSEALGSEALVTSFKVLKSHSTEEGNSYSVI